MLKRLIILVGFVLTINSPLSHAFGVDVCFNDPNAGEDLIRNCIDVKRICRTDDLSRELEIICRVKATSDSLSGLSDGNSIIGGRSLLHSDSTYVMAQLIGFSTWQAYQMMIYSEATDQSQYIPFNQKGIQMLTDDEVEDCQNQWGYMPNKCLAMTPEMLGIYKFNWNTGGMLLHLSARYSPYGKPLPRPGYPGNYLANSNIKNEVLLGNLRAWIYDERDNACAAGITQPATTADSLTSPCAYSSQILKSPINAFAPGFSKLAIPFVTNLGPLIIHEQNEGNVLANNLSFDRYINPHDIEYAKMGIFLHSYGDRFSHHVCTDRSYFYSDDYGNYNSQYSSVYCAQGSHFLWHVWEQGTIQNKISNKNHHTMRPALEAVYDELIDYANHQGIAINQATNKKMVIDNLMKVLQIYNPTFRLQAMVNLMEGYGLFPLPGHGSAANLSIDMWLQRAGAPVYSENVCCNSKSLNKQ